MHNWHFLLFAFLVGLQPISSFTERNIVNGREECCDRQSLLLQDSWNVGGSSTGNRRLPKSISDDRHLSERDVSRPQRYELRSETRPQFRNIDNIRQSRVEIRRELAARNIRARAPSISEDRELRDTRRASQGQSERIRDFVRVTTRIGHEVDIIQRFRSASGITRDIREERSTRLILDSRHEESRRHGNNREEIVRNRQVRDMQQREREDVARINHRNGRDMVDLNRRSFSIRSELRPDIRNSRTETFETRHDFDRKTISDRVNVVENLKRQTRSNSRSTDSVHETRLREISHQRFDGKRISTRLYRDNRERTFERRELIHHNNVRSRTDRIENRDRVMLDEGANNEYNREVTERKTMMPERRQTDSRRMLDQEMARNRFIRMEARDKRIDDRVRDTRLDNNIHQRNVPEVRFENRREIRNLYFRSNDKSAKQRESIILKANEHKHIDQQITNWQYIFYTLQGIYLVGILMQMLTKPVSGTKKRNVGWWNCSKNLIKAD